MRQFLIPGVGYINVKATRQYLVPGTIYVNEYVATGSGQALLMLMGVGA